MHSPEQNASGVVPLVVAFTPLEAKLSAILLYLVIYALNIAAATMMLSKSNDDETKPTDTTGLTPPKPLHTQSAADSVRDLERRLQAMSEPKPAPAPKPAPMAPKPAPAAAAPKATGKNALLVRVKTRNDPPFTK